MVQFTRDKRYGNVNGLGKHQQLRAEHWENMMRNPGPTIDVNMYIDDCKIDFMAEGERYEVMDDNVNCLKEKYRQPAWKARWAHNGRDGQMKLAV